MLGRIGVYRILASILAAFLLACGGGGGGSDTPVAPPPPLPTITSVAPLSAHVDDTVTVTGTNLVGTHAVTFGGASANTFTVHGSTSITAVVPFNAITGLVSISTPEGSASSASALTILVDAPTISTINPTQGPVGTGVSIAGTQFTPGTTVAFNGQPATISSVTSTQLNVLVPSGATTGPITVDNGVAPAASAPFTVTAGSVTLDLFVDSWYITQATQDYLGTVPLVASRDGFLRVFVRANETNDLVPEVRVTVNGTETTLATPSGVTTSGVPTTINEGNLNRSWGLAIPGGSISTPLTVRIEVDRGNTIPEADETNNVVDATPSVQTAKIFSTTIIPVVQSGLTGNVTTGRTLNDWVSRFQRMYPMQNLPAGINVLQGATYTTTANLNTGASGPAISQAGWNQLLGEIEDKRFLEAPSRYYYGVANVSYGSGIAGLGYVGAPTAIGWDKTGYTDGGNYPEVFAHEVGHNLNQWHANCGGPSGVDPFWNTAPANYANAAIGVYGYDVANSALKAPGSFKDIMAYCSPAWVSDFTYKSIMSFRDTGGGLRVVEAAVPVQECLLVSGRVKNGQVTLKPAFRVATVPQPPAPGSYTLQLRDAQGGLLLETSFEPVAIADLPGEPEAHFVFTVPVSGTPATLQVLRAGATQGVLAASAASRIVGGREPVATRLRAGEAHLSWDPMVHPKVMVRDPRTGEVLSFAEGGSVDIVTDATELDVTFSDGVNSTRRFLKVQ